MIFQSDQRVDLPTTDLITYVFSNSSFDHDAPVYIDESDPTRSISYNQARAVVRQLVAGLKAWGVQKGDCVAIHSFNDIYYSMLVLAIVGVGAIFTGTNPSYTPMELAHHFKASQTKFIISEPELLTTLRTAMRDVEIPETNLRIFNVLGQAVPAGFTSWQSLLSAGESDWVQFDDPKTCKETPAARLFSSGTTGMPKAVTLTHQNFIAQHHLVFDMDKRPFRLRRIVPLPMFHAAAAPSTHFTPLKGGHIVIVMRRFELLEFLAAVEKHQITDLILVPAIIIAIIMNPQAHERPYLKGVRTSLSGAAPLGKEEQAKLKAMLADGGSCTQCWGMTEMSCVVTKFQWNEQDDTGSVGRLMPNLEAKLVDDEGNDISAYGVRGEICLRGPTVTPGYFENPIANRESFDADGWYHTGDVGYCDEGTNKWYIVDRKKELIKVRGFQVAPPELEAILLSHPHIIDAAVIGLRGVRIDTELPRAYVVRRPGTGDALTEAAVQKYLGTRLAKYKALTGGVKFVDAIPKNASGKILKKILREESQKEIRALAKSKL
ncbi:AMP-binding enzyme [Aspergillus avenaceus]|uniref:AMP-binding enzyme n=1 Tax=Aspergillus avenaceus TaxID=36643 RepID=A0A5N6U494_ASPAV|nr:AMP-binding enzyme [Aspergillus avenaceus]